MPGPYRPRGDLAIVRRQRVQALICFIAPFTAIVVRWMFGRKTRFVFLCEKLTLLPELFVLPQNRTSPSA